MTWSEWTGEEVASETLMRGAEADEGLSQAKEKCRRKEDVAVMTEMMKLTNGPARR